MYKVLIAVLVVTVAMIVVFTCIDPNIANSVANTATTLVTNIDKVNVSIDGEVVRPGTYLLEINTSLSNLIEVAGGVTSNADELAFDTSYLLKDGLSFYIAPKYDNNDVCSMEPIKKVNINESDAEGLKEVNGIGSTVAKAIVEYRTANGLFKRLEDIKEVSGIGNATFEKVKKYLVLRNAWDYFTF